MDSKSESAKDMLVVIEKLQKALDDFGEKLKSFDEMRDRHHKECVALFQKCNATSGTDRSALDKEMTSLTEKHAAERKELMKND